MKTTTSQLTRNNSVVATDIQNELLLFNPVTKVAFVMNSTAKIIWESLNGLAETDNIVGTLKPFAGNENVDIDSDVNAFFGKLEEAGLLIPGAGVQPGNFKPTIQEGYTYVAPAFEVYSEDFLREHLKDVSFATFHDDTYSDLGNPPVKK